MITIALPKGKLLDTSIDLFARIGIESLEDMNKSRKLIFDTNCDGFRFMIIRAADVPTYVEYGAADLGIVGRDVLLEQEYDVYEPLDLKFGYCRLMVAEPKELSVGDDIRNWCNVRIATKFPNITEKFFASKGIPVEIIKLYGSMELAPLVGLSERIVDLVETGKTLEANGLVPVELIAETTARLIANRASLKTKYRDVNRIIEQLKKEVMQ